MAGDPAHARGDFLDRRHQRKREQHGPADAEAELRAGLAIGADAGGIVVGCAGDQTGTERLHEERKPRRRGGVGRHGRVAFQPAVNVHASPRSAGYANVSQGMEFQPV
jgi:hypothetical protein